MFSLKNKIALVTGASSGIGEAIARMLAEAGAQLVLVARSEAALCRISEELTETYGTHCTVITADLSARDCAVNLQREIDSKNFQIDILINNAGFGTYGPFESLSAQAEQREIAVNISAVVALTHAFIPGMLARRSGAVLNIASTAAFQPAPYMAVYAATKAFVLSFSEALWAEFNGRGVHVAALCPGPVDTSFIDKLEDASIRQTSVFSKTVKPEYVAEMALNALLSSRPTHIVGLKNWLLANSIRFAPRRVVAKAGASMLRPSHLKS
jgi:short-subunit dehydrogenase